MAKYDTFNYGEEFYGETNVLEGIAGVSHHIVMDDIGYIIAGVPNKSDITSAIPRVSVGTDQKKHTDFSERDTWGQNSYHHGRGALDVEDPYTFFSSNKLCTWVPNQLTLMPRTYTGEKTTGGTELDGYPVDILRFEGNLYFLVYGEAPATNALYLFNNSTDRLDLVNSGLNTSIGSPSDLHPFDGSMFVAQGEQVNARRFDGSSWYDFGVPATRFESFDGFLWRADNIYELYYTDDPLEDNLATWQGPLEVGDRTYPIRNMVAGFDGALWVGKDDGIYSVRKITDVNYQVTKVIDLQNCVCSTNGAAMINFGGSLFFTAGFTLVRYDGASIQFMGPDRGAHETEKFYNLQTQFGQPIVPQTTELLPPTYQAGMTGYVRDLSHDNNFLYAAVDNQGESNSAVMLWTGTGWHTVYEADDSASIRTVYFSRSANLPGGTLNYPLIWFDHGEELKWIRMSRYSHNPLDDTSLVYEDSGNLVTGWFDAGLIDIPKSFFDLTMNALSLAPGTDDRIIIEFQVDDYPVWYQLGINRASPENTLFFPDNSSNLDPSIIAKKIRYRFTLEHEDGNPNKTPILRSWGHRFVVRPDSRYGWNFIIKCYDEMQDLRRQRIDGYANEYRRRVYNLREKRTPIILSDGTELPSVTNLVLNPACQIDSNNDGLADHFSEIGNVQTFLTAQYKSTGVLSQGVTLLFGETGVTGLNVGSYPAEAGQRIYASASVYHSGGNPVFLEVLHDGEVVAARRIDPVGSFDLRFQDFYVFFTAEETGLYNFRIVREEDPTLTALETTFYADKFQFIVDDPEILSFPNVDYIDGDQIRCFWNGDAHNSTSVRQPGYYVYMTTLTESLRYYEDKKDSTTINSEITVTLREVS